MAWLGALQAQDFAGALWSIGIRLHGDARIDAVTAAIADRSIVRTWAVRGTLHFVHASDVRWLLALVAPRIITQLAGRYRALELDAADFHAARDVLARELAGGRQCTRAEIAAMLQNAGISTAGQRLSHLLSRAALDRLICFGTRRGAQFTFTLLDEWVPHGPALEHADALAELARRYFTSRGPATIRDFVWWSGLTTRHARIGVDAAAPHLARESIGGTPFWRAADADGPAPRADDEPAPRAAGSDTPAAPAADRPPHHSAWLLPGFDEFVVAYQQRSAILQRSRIPRITLAGGMLTPTFVVAGQVVGTWRRRNTRDGVTVDVTPLTRFTADDWRQLRSAAARYARYLGHTVTAGIAGAERAAPTPI